MKNLTCLLAFLIGTSLLAQNRVLNFDGVDDRIAVNSPVTGTDDFTAEIWFQGTNGNTLTASIFGWGPQSGGNMDRFMVVSNNNKLKVLDDNYNGGASFVLPFLFDIDDDDKWHHVAVVKDSNEITIYLDNATPYTYTSGIANPFNLLPDLALGRPGSSNWTWNGEMDEFRLWDYARTQEQILSTRNCLLNGDEAGLAIYYDFENTIQVPFQNLIPDRTFPTENGLMQNFEDNSGLIFENIGVNNSCSGDTICEVSFSFERDPCSATYDFFAEDNDQGNSYFWEITSPAGETVNYETPNVTHTFEFFDFFTNSNEVCLTISFDDGCQNTYCENFTRPLSDQSYYSITTAKSPLSSI